MLEECLFILFHGAIFGTHHCAVHPPTSSQGCLWNRGCLPSAAQEAMREGSGGALISVLPDRFRQALAMRVLPALFGLWSDETLWLVSRIRSSLPCSSPATSNGCLLVTTGLTASVAMVSRILDIGEATLLA